MNVNVENHDGVCVIAVDGDVDLYSSPQVRDAILRAVKAKAETLIVDLAGVGYMDSSGVATLVEGLQLTRDYRGAFRLANLRSRVREVFQLARLEKVFEIFDDLEAAKAG